MPAISLLLALLLLPESSSSSVQNCAAERYVSALGDRGMKNLDNEAPSMENPRLADCADLSCLILADPPQDQTANFIPRIKQGNGWIGDPRTWEVNGALSSRLYFYLEYPGTKPAKRMWTSINVVTDIYVSNRQETAEWTVSDFDVLVQQKETRSS
ncbi:unnamed protein product [Arabidopsis thaliana]|uniref:DUF7705 domain-containing protein n=1 Tax=Arabidopsis thaliana TaxID=3702 RepID=A0A5S9XQW4_ARATH|nr:unnamed protein product [Arabidopsis thaliana]